MIDGSEIYADDLSELPVATGDLYFPVDGFERPDCGGIVLTPICDLAHEKTPWVKTAIAIPFWTYLAEEFIPAELKNRNEFKEWIEQDSIAFGEAFLSEPSLQEDKIVVALVTNLKKILQNVSPLKSSHYYLPGKNEPTKGFLVDFTHIISISYQILKSQTPLSRLKSPWREQLVNRYVGFSLRVGTDDYSQESIVNIINAFFPDVTRDKIQNKAFPVK